MERSRCGTGAALLAAFLLLPAGRLCSATGPFAYSNGYFRVAGDGGLIVDLRLDASGNGAYGSNTIASGGHFAFRLDGTLMTSPSADVSTTGDGLRITNLPEGAEMILTFSDDTLSCVLRFAGSREVTHEWDLVHVDAGFYQRATGRNVRPDLDVDMPFESFYSIENGNFRCVEMFKRTAGPPEGGDPRDVSWPGTYCRGRRTNDVVVTGSIPLESFEPQSDRLTLLHEGTRTAQCEIILQVRPKTYAAVLEGNRPLPEFYVVPPRQVAALSDPSVTHDAGDLLTEFFHHMTFWWGSRGHSGGIWTDWAMTAGCFMDTPFRETAAGQLLSWVLGDDGYGHRLYAYTWGSDRGWPFPDGRDTRHFNTNAIFITALWRYVMWTGDLAFLLSGDTDRLMTIGYADGGTEKTVSSWDMPAQLGPGSTLGQTFTATAPFNRVAPHTPTWGTTDSGCTVALYDRIGGSPIAQRTFTNVSDNLPLFLDVPEQPAGEYYLEISDPVGTIGWWTLSRDEYAGGQSVTDGIAAGSLLDRARRLMDYQQQTLLGETEHQLVLGINTGTADHGGRHRLDVGSNYYDILPFGYHDALTDINYVQSLRAMADLEEWMGNGDRADAYHALLEAARDRFNETYWRTGLDREGRSRYIGCVDVDGNDHDFGYTFVNTMAIAAGLAEGRADRVRAVFDWLDEGECRHGDASPVKRIRITYEGGGGFYNVDPRNEEHVPLRLTGVLKQDFLAAEPFTAVSAHNPTWTTTDSGFRLSLIRAADGEVVAEGVFSNVVDNSFNTLHFPVQPAGMYRLRMSDPVGTIGWWAATWAEDVYGRWVFAPRTSTLRNESWWQAAVGGDPASPSFPYRWDLQLQNGGCDLYESGFDVVARARAFDADSAWERLTWILRRYADPDRLSGNSGFYGESIQGGALGPGAVGWVWSEFPETSVLGAAFFNGFFGIDVSPRGLRMEPHVPTGHGITAIGARNISYRGALFDFEATTNSVRVTCTRNPGDKTFYMTGGIRGSGTFEVEVPLRDGVMTLSPAPLRVNTGLQIY